jgi:hypothetical protein
MPSPSVSKAEKYLSEIATGFVLPIQPVVGSDRLRAATKRTGTLMRAVES